MEADFQVEAGRRAAAVLQAAGRADDRMDKRSGNFRFDEAELARVPRAIERAEAGTQAEIFAVLAERSDNYRFVAYGFLALWIFIFSAVLALWWQWQAGFGVVCPIRRIVTSAILDDWGLNNRGEGNGPGVPISLLSVFVAGQIAAFVTGVLVIRMFPGAGGCHYPAKNCP